MHYFQNIPHNVKDYFLTRSSARGATHPPEPVNTIVFPKLFFFICLLRQSQVEEQRQLQQPVPLVLHQRRGTLAVTTTAAVTTAAAGTTAAAATTAAATIMKFIKTWGSAVSPAL